MVLSLFYMLVCRVLQLVVLLGRGERAPTELEIFVLRHELAILRHQRKKPRFSTGDRVGCINAAGFRGRGV